ncbi:hypothetical protein TNCV_3768061 [Trichonephila clavipes]|nr:hypothetical protein TNCV_3768061 [Trichonephila clavipes]
MNVLSSSRYHHHLPLKGYQLYAAYCPPFVENRAALMLQNATAVLRSVHRQVWLLVALLLSRRVFKPFFVSLGLDMDCSSHGQLFVECSRIFGDGNDEFNANCGINSWTNRSIVSKPQDLH